MKITNKTSVALLLAAGMTATRFHYQDHSLPLPDASTAIFFLGGLAGLGGRVFLGFLGLAGLLDFVSITFGGVSGQCVTPAYAFLAAAYGALWLGGRWSSRRSDAVAGLPTRTTALAVSAAAAFAISSGAFYLLSGYFTSPNLSEFVERIREYGVAEMGTPLLYVLPVLLIRAMARTALPSRRLADA